MKEQTALFKPSIVAQLAQAARLEPINGSHKEIANKLSEIGHTFLLNRHWQSKPPPSAIALRLRAIRSAVEELSKKLPQAGEVRYRLTAQAAIKASTPELTKLVSGHERLNSVASIIGELGEWARAAEKREAGRMGRRAGHQGDEATQSLVNGLAEIWVAYWGRGPGTSRSFWTAETYGPFVRFFRAYGEALLEKLGAEAAQDEGLRESLELTSEAIRARARKTPVARLGRLERHDYSSCELPVKSEIQKR
jgi:hypothetical protein